MAWCIKPTLATTMSIWLIYSFLRFFFRPGTMRAKGRGGKVPTMHTAGASSSASPLSSTPPTTVIQHERQGYYDLAQRLRHLLPQACSWLGSDDVCVIGTTPFSSGGFSEVWQGSLEGRPVVMKSLRIYSSPEFDPAEVGVRFLKEAWVSSQLSHPNIVPFLGVCSTPNHPFSLLYAMMENIDLGRYLADHPNVSRLKLLVGISRALKYIHNLDIVHGNVRVRNVLVDNDGVARLGGFGSAFSLSLPASWSDIDTGQLFCGVAPELINPPAFGLVHARTTKATDMFAFGMLAWEVLAGRPPFSGRMEAAVVFSVFQDDRPPRPVHPEVSNGMWKMIQSCWERNPFKRMTAADVVGLLEAEM